VRGRATKSRAQRHRVGGKVMHMCMDGSISEIESEAWKICNDSPANLLNVVTRILLAVELRWKERTMQPDQSAFSCI